MKCSRRIWFDMTLAITIFRLTSQALAKMLRRSKTRACPNRSSSSGVRLSLESWLSFVRSIRDMKIDCSISPRIWQFHWGFDLKEVKRDSDRQASVQVDHDNVRNHRWRFPIVRWNVGKCSLMDQHRCPMLFKLDDHVSYSSMHLSHRVFELNLSSLVYFAWSLLSSSFNAVRICFSSENSSQMPSCTSSYVVAQANVLQRYYEHAI